MDLTKPKQISSSSSSSGRKMILNSFILACSIALIAASGAIERGAEAAAPAPPNRVNPLVKVKYITSEPLRMHIKEVRDVRVQLEFGRYYLPDLGADNFTVTFKCKTLSPQFDILEVDRTGISFSRRQLEATNFVHSFSLRLRATYIGQAVVSPDLISYGLGRAGVLFSADQLEDIRPMELRVTVAPIEGIWDKLFIVSVSALIVLSYINLGAQLDVENLKQLIRRPWALIAGYTVGVVVMPLITWFIGGWLLRDQLIYRVGSFIFAACPTATASALWTVMFRADKELAVGLQVISTIGAQLTMPLLLYFMDTFLLIEGSKYSIRVPYARLTQTLFVLLVALFIGWYFIGRNERAQKISRKLFRPFTFFFLLFIVIFSSLVYWYIYIMFDRYITLATFLIALATYLIAGLLGYLINCDLDHAITISISSAYKNAGISFGVLLVAFESPDMYIAYVPCLTQVVTSSLTLYLVYSIYFLVNYVKRRNQPEQIQATTNSDQDSKNTQAKKRNSRSGSGGSDKSATRDDGENEEFIVMNVTDVVSGSPPTTQPTTGDEQVHKMDAQDKQHDESNKV